MTSPNSFQFSLPSYRTHNVRNILDSQIDNIFKERITTQPSDQTIPTFQLPKKPQIHSEQTELQPELQIPALNNQKSIEKLIVHDNKSRLRKIQVDDHKARQQVQFNISNNPKGKLSSYISSVASENIKNFENSNEDNSLEDMQKKLQMLQEVFGKILEDKNILTYVDPQEVQKVKNVYSFILKVSSKLSSENIEDLRVKEKYKQDITQFLKGFGDPEGYNEYYIELLQRAQQIKNEQNMTENSQPLQQSQSLIEQEKKKEYQKFDLSNNQSRQIDLQESSSSVIQQSNILQTEESQKQDSQVGGQLEPKMIQKAQFLKIRLLSLLNWAHQFIQNPINIARCLMLALSLLFLSSYLSAPELTNQSPKYVLDWLAYNKNSKTLLITGGLWYCCFLFFGIRQFYISSIASFRKDQERQLGKLLLESNPILHISIVYMTDSSTIPQKLDLAIWLCIYSTFSILHSYQSLAFSELRRLLSNISEDYDAEMETIQKLKRFSVIILLINIYFCTIGIWAFSESGWHRMALLFYEGFILGFDSLKLIICENKLKNNMHFYINPNTEQVTDPLFMVEAVLESVTNIISLMHYFQLIANYFIKLDYQYILHLWLLYLVKKMSSSFRQIKKNFIGYKKYKSIQLNLDILFPKIPFNQLSPNDLCSICHDELLVARKIQTCGHHFHIKCLFKWLNARQNSRCPICRTEIPSLNFDQRDKGSTTFFGRSIRRIFGVFSWVGSVLMPRREDGGTQQVRDNLNDDGEQFRAEEEIANITRGLNETRIQNRENERERDMQLAEQRRQMRMFQYANRNNIHDQEQEGQEEEEEEEKNMSENQDDQEDDEFQDIGIFNQIAHLVGQSQSHNNNSINNDDKTSNQMQSEGLDQSQIEILKLFQERLEREQQFLLNVLMNKFNPSIDMQYQTQTIQNQSPGNANHLQQLENENALSSNSQNNTEEIEQLIEDDDNSNNEQFQENQDDKIKQDDDHTKKEDNICIQPNIQQQNIVQSNKYGNSIITQEQDDSAHEIPCKITSGAIQTVHTLQEQEQEEEKEKEKQEQEEQVKDSIIQETLTSEQNLIQSNELEQIQINEKESDDVVADDSKNDVI